MLSPLHEMGFGTPIQDKKPDIQVRFQYDFPEKNIVLLLAERRTEDKDELEELGFRQHIQYKVEGDAARDRSQFVCSAIERWEQELKEFEELSFRLFSMYSSKEN